jgi:Kef-type K+ transport system membrane component KefB
MARAAAFLLLLGLMLLLRRTVAPEGIAALRTIDLALGVALVAASLLGDLAERVRLPRLSGYLFFGLISGPYVLSLLTPAMARQLQVVNGLAIALIAIIAGLEINFGRMRSRLRAILTFGGVTILVMFGGLFALLSLAWPWLPIAPAAGGLERIAMAAVVTTLVVSFSPTVTIAVIAESRARGPLSELVLAVVVLADLALILFFTFAMQFVRWVSAAGAADDISLFVRLLWEIVGSLCYGALIGATFALYLRFVGRELTVVLLGLCALITGTAAWLHFEALLVALAAGLVVENIAPPEGDALRDAVERGALPVLVVFFVAAGAMLQLDALAEIWLLAVVLSLARIGWIRAGTAVGRRAAGLEAGPSGATWMGLVSQAGVTLGLTTIVAGEFTDWGIRVQALMVALIALHEIVGPILFRAALTEAGEIGRLDAGQAGQAGQAGYDPRPHGAGPSSSP